MQTLVQMENFVYTLKAYNVVQYRRFAGPPWNRDHLAEPSFCVTLYFHLRLRTWLLSVSLFQSKLVNITHFLSFSSNRWFSRTRGLLILPCRSPFGFRHHRSRVAASLRFGSISDSFGVLYPQQSHELCCIQQRGECELRLTRYKRFLAHFLAFKSFDCLEVMLKWFSGQIRLLDTVQNGVFWLVFHL